MTGQIKPGIDAIENLEDFILVNRLSANMKIPPENTLCKMWGISRTTVRNAINELIETGVLYRIPRSGVYVADSKLIRNMSGVDSLAEVKQQGNPVTKKILRYRVTEAAAPIAEKLGIAASAKVHEYTTQRLINYSPAILEMTYIGYENYPDLGIRYSEKTSMDPLFRKHYHKKPSRGEEHVSVTYAGKEEAEALAIPEGSPVFFASGVVEDQDNSPIYYYKQLIRTDRFKLVSVIDCDEDDTGDL